MGMDQDNLIIAPYTTVMKRLLAQNYLQSISASAIAEEYSDQAIDEISQILRENHKIKPGEDDNFTVRSQQEMMETMSSTMDTITLILVVAAGFSLLVAGIGIMNIMLVSVTERTREIGLRMSVGARGFDISAQFLIESIIISLSGGIRRYLHRLARHHRLPHDWLPGINTAVEHCCVVYRVHPHRRGIRLLPGP